MCGFRIQERWIQESGFEGFAGAGRCSRVIPEAVRGLRTKRILQQKMIGAKPGAPGTFLLTSWSWIVISGVPANGREDNSMWRWSLARDLARSFVGFFRRRDALQRDDDPQLADVAAQPLQTAPGSRLRLGLRCVGQKLLKERIIVRQGFGRGVLFLSVAEELPEGAVVGACRRWIALCRPARGWRGWNPGG